MLPFGGQIAPRLCGGVVQHEYGVEASFAEAVRSAAQQESGKRDAGDEQEQGGCVCRDVAEGVVACADDFRAAEDYIYNKGQNEEETAQCGRSFTPEIEVCGAAPLFQYGALRNTVEVQKGFVGHVLTYGGVGVGDDDGAADRGQGVDEQVVFAAGNGEAVGVSVAVEKALLAHGHIGCFASDGTLPGGAEAHELCAETFVDGAACRGQIVVLVVGISQHEVGVAVAVGSQMCQPLIGSRPAVGLCQNRPFCPCGLDAQCQSQLAAVHVVRRCRYEGVAQIGVRCSQMFNVAASVVARSVVHDDDFKFVEVLCEDMRQVVLQFLQLVAAGNDDAQSGPCGAEQMRRVVAGMRVAVLGNGGREVCVGAALQQFVGQGIVAPAETPQRGEAESHEAGQ